MNQFTQNKYINIPEYKETSFLHTLSAQTTLPEETLLSILYLANLATFLISLIDQTGTWSTTTAEAKTLSLHGLYQHIPQEFLPDDVPTDIAKNLKLELACQIFRQAFSDAVDTD